LKEIFKGAATTVITQMGDHPLCVNYYRQVNKGMRPHLAKVTLARRIAAIVLTMWKHEEVYDPTRVTVVTDNT
jgi:hypothetical protein